MEMKVIKTDSEYQFALSELERLIDLDPDPGEKDADKLELQSLLIESYETEHFPIDLPDPIDAIEFVMDQRELSQKDLIPFLGSRSKVSEVLSRKRPLTLSMIRALNKGLNIPAEVLLNEPGASLADGEDIEWERFPLREMINRKWIQASAKDARDKAEELIREFFAPLGGVQNSPILYKRSFIRAARGMNDYALDAWRARVLMRALEHTAPDYKKSLISKEFLREVVRLSRAENGPLLARDYLMSYGIIFIYERHLPRTYLDGASFLTPKGNPVVALTLRYDRLDNFWFVLMHELIHVWKHLSGDVEIFIDDLDHSDVSNPDEKEADDLATEILVPTKEWESSEASLGSAFGVQELAERLRIHPAIVAGKIRREENNYRKLNNLVGHGEVRKLFEN